MIADANSLTFLYFLFSMFFLFVHLFRLILKKKEKIFFGDILAVAKLLVLELFYNVLGCLRRERDDEFEPYTDNSDLWVYKVN